MKYKCLVFDHDDTVVNSTATIHHPCFQEYLNSRYPGRTCSLEDYFKMNFAPGFVEMCREEYGMDDAALQDELEYWRAYVENHIPLAYPGIREIMERQKEEGGLICVVSHSLEHNIRRDYKANSLPEPDAVYGWDYPPVFTTCRTLSGMIEAGSWSGLRHSVWERSVLFTECFQACWISQRKLGNQQAYLIESPANDEPNSSEYE